MNQLEKNLLSKFKSIPEGVTPGFVLQAYAKGLKVCDVQFGKTWPYYDLASLTKIIFTVPLMIRAVSDDKVDLFLQIKKYLSWYPHKAVSKDLLSHCAGNEWWMPFYKCYENDLPVEMKKTIIKEKMRAQLLSKDKSKAVYSDVDFLLLGFILEAVYNKKWSELWQGLVEDVFKRDALFFNENNQPNFPVDRFAPTENCPWRKRILQGEVHDENAWSLGGVAPQAGLFGSADAVSEWALWLRAHVYGLKNTWADSLLFQRFAQRSFPANKGDWSLGFMLPTVGSASCGDRFSKISIGHTGFTGTSFWFDLEKDIFVVLLSNRIHPTRHNEMFRKLRPQIHNWVMEELGY